MLGGARAFDSGGYADSSLKDVLPVELDGKGSYQAQGPVRPVLTPSGKAHPVTRLLPDPKGNEEVGKNAGAFRPEPGPQRQRGNASIGGKQRLRRYGATAYHRPFWQGTQSRFNER